MKPSNESNKSNKNNDKSKNYSLLKLKQALPLDMKIQFTKRAIEEFVDMYGVEGVYISFSGGKDSTVLVHIVRSMYPTIEAVFGDTGLEFPEVKTFVDSVDNVTIIKPKLSFKQVIEKYGYPIISKEQSNYIYRVRNTKSIGEYNKYFHGINRDGSKSMFKVAEKHKYLIDAPFKISDKCCEKLKKDPFKMYEKSTGKKGIIGTMASESKQRERDYLKYGCNAFEKKRPASTRSH